MKAYLLAIGMGMALTLAATSAQADNLEEAKAAFAAGKIAFERGDWEQALQQFQRANLLAPAPSLSYNIGKTYEKMGRYRDAAFAFQRYLELQGPPQTDDEKKFQEELRGRIEVDQRTPDQPVQPQAPQQPAYPQQPVYQQPQPNYYQPQPYANPYGANPYGVNPYGAPQLSKQERLAAARKHRNSGIAVFAIGTALTAVAVGVLSALPSTDNDSTVIAFGTVGVIFGISGPIMLGVGAAQWGKYQGQMNRITKEPDVVVPGQPNAVIFHAPTLRF